ncbi:hypothetical protein ACQ4PT_050943 [Festuca glaucescens]
MVPWRATFVYGEPRCELRYIFWDMLRRLRRGWDGPWICCGDFNEVLYQDEHYGSRDRSDAQMELFRDCLDACNLVDLGFSGPKFTWSNRQDAQCNVRVRLDRAVPNDSFSSIFEGCNVENIITTSSDHYALLISLTAVSPHFERTPVKQGFRYEAMWKRAEDYASVVEAAWQPNSTGPNPLQATWANLNQMAGSLKDWSCISFGSVRRQIKKLEGKLRELRNSGINASVIAEEREVERQLCELFEREEVMARQRSRVEWLREGDRNTAFFHAKASARKKTNCISSLIRANGSMRRTRSTSASAPTPAASSTRPTCPTSPTSTASSPRRSACAPPLLLPHEAAADCKLHGYDVAAGTILLVNAHVINRDPATWGPAPEEFRPERFEHGAAEGKLMISFGMGRRKCPGESLAIRTMGLVLGTLILCFDWTRVGEEDVDMAATSGTVMLKAVPLEALCTPRPCLHALLHHI